jgi:hypothetical protein
MPQAYAPATFVNRQPLMSTSSGLFLRVNFLRSMVSFVSLLIPTVIPEPEKLVVLRMLPLGIQTGRKGFVRCIQCECSTVALCMKRVTI